MHFAIWWLVPEQRHIVMMDLSPQALCECAGSGDYKNDTWLILFSIYGINVYVPQKSFMVDLRVTVLGKVYNVSYCLKSVILILFFSDFAKYFKSTILP